MWLKRVLAKIGVIQAAEPKPLFKLDLNKKAEISYNDVPENVTRVESYPNDPPSATEEETPPSIAKEKMKPVGVGEADVIEPRTAANHGTNEPTKEDAEHDEMPDPSKDMAAYIRWVMDGRRDNMHQCENLLF